jgi:hypothetical protein
VASSFAEVLGAGVVTLAGGAVAVQGANRSWIVTHPLERLELDFLPMRLAQAVADAEVTGLLTPGELPEFADSFNLLRRPVWVAGAR